MRTWESQRARGAAPGACLAQPQGHPSPGSAYAVPGLLLEMAPAAPAKGTWPSSISLRLRSLFLPCGAASPLGCSLEGAGNHPLVLHLLFSRKPSWPSQPAQATSCVGCLDAGADEKRRWQPTLQGGAQW